MLRKQLLPSYPLLYKQKRQGREQFLETIRSFLKENSTENFSIIFDKRIIDLGRGDVLRFRIAEDKHHSYCKETIGEGFKVAAYSKKLKQKSKHLRYLGTKEEGHTLFHYYSIRISSKLKKDLIIEAFSNRNKESSFLLITKEEQERKIRDYVDETISIDLDKRYDDWVKQSSCSVNELQKQRETLFENKVSYSIIIPLYRTKIEFFRQAVDSVIQQSYTNFELLLVRADDESEELKAETEKYQKKDNRIKIVTIPKNKGITENTNSGIECASGDFLCFMDHDDIVEPNLLFEYTKAINENNNLDILCCNEDLLAKDGTFKFAMQKPEVIDINMLLSGNYICHMLAIRHSLFHNVEKPTSKYDGAQDYNLTLRCLEKGRGNWCVQLPLYHWRISETSTAGNPNDKPYANTAGRIVLKEHFKRTNTDAEVIDYPDMLFLYLPVYKNKEDSNYAILDSRGSKDDLLEHINSLSCPYLVCKNQCELPPSEDISRLTGYLAQNDTILATTIKLAYRDDTVKSTGYFLGENNLYPIFTDMPTNHGGFMIKNLRDHSVFCADPDFVIVRRLQLQEFSRSNYTKFVDENNPEGFLMNFMLNKKKSDTIAISPYTTAYTDTLPEIDYRQKCIHLKHRDLLPSYDPNVGRLVKRTNGYMQFNY